MSRRPSGAMPASINTKQHYLAQCKAREMEERRCGSEKRIKEEKIGILYIYIYVMK